MKCYAYTDESGNSGLELFNTDQESFWTGTLIAFSDVDTKHAAFHKELLNTVGKKELHGNELGFGRIEKIAARLSWFIREKKIRFSFEHVHKPFLAATKLFDLVFDSGANKGMPWHAYNVRQLRLMVLMHFVQLLGRGDLERFWTIFRAQNAEMFGTFLKDIADRVPHAPYDARTIQILSEALAWGSQHPTEILDPFGVGDSPNFVAFTSLFRDLHTFHEQEGHVIGSFVHDEQDEFVPSFRGAYDFLTKFQLKDSAMSLIADIRELPTFDCPLVVRSSHTSFGLQMVDVCLWLVRRVLERGDKPRGHCQTLFQCLVEKSWIAAFDFESVVHQVKIGADEIYSRPFTQEDEARGRKLLSELEESRIARLKASEE